MPPSEQSVVLFSQERAAKSLKENSNQMFNKKKNKWMQGAQLQNE